MTPKQIKSYRLKLLMTQAQLGEALDVTANTVARWERGEAVPESPKMLHLALRALELERGIDRSGEIARTRKRVTEKLQRTATLLRKQGKQFNKREAA